MNQNKNESKKEHPESIWPKVWKQWKIGIGIFAAPYIIIPLIACVLSLYFATYQITDQSFSVVLNIIAALLLAVASGGIWDTVKNIMGNTLLIKKGNSAVRNLSLARLKVKKISERTKTKASPEEIMNLLGFLEKDVANYLQ
jgi:flagellar biosynthesis protein FliQ